MLKSHVREILIAFELITFETRIDVTVTQDTRTNWYSFAYFYVSIDIVSDPNFKVFLFCLQKKSWRFFQAIPTQSIPIKIQLIFSLQTSISLMVLDEPFVNVWAS